MSKEIEENTREYFAEKFDGTKAWIHSYCYLNTNTKQYFWVSEEITDTERVKHLVRISVWDKIAKVIG